MEDIRILYNPLLDTLLEYLPERNLIYYWDEYYQVVFGKIASKELLEGYIEIC